LTSVHIVEQTSITNITTNNLIDHRPHRQIILTSDRDEKIRVSHFPETYCIEGFLLGHTAFVSSVALLSSSSSSSIHQCLSVGGDGTIRLWDYTTCNELAFASTKVESNTSTSDKTVECDKGGHDQSQNNPTELIPTKVAATMDGSVVVTIYDDCKTLDFWTIRKSSDNDSIDNDNFAIERIHRWECPGQPIGITFQDSDTFFLIIQEPEYLQQYKVILDETVGCTTIKQILHIESKFCLTMNERANSKSIVMPDGLLEKDEYGCLKMSKMSERRGGSTLQPWNNAARKDTNAERIRRLRMRRREEYQKQRQMEQFQQKLE
jgi:tRNA (guanine-N(7)-)-methyltransferase subunit TRM82